MDLPTYTNIWRIEKRLYKLYDFRLPMPLPIGQLTVFAAIAVPYVVLLTLLGLPFNHKLIWLYVLPPGVLTWLATRPVLESKRLPELVGSQLRYLAEPRVWCRMAPLAEKDVIVVTGRVWRQSGTARRPATAPATAPATGRRWPAGISRSRPAGRPATSPVGMAASRSAGLLADRSARPSPFRPSGTAVRPSGPAVQPSGPVRPSGPAVRPSGLLARPASNGGLKPAGGLPPGMAAGQLPGMAAGQPPGMAAGQPPVPGTDGATPAAPASAGPQRGLVTVVNPRSGRTVPPAVERALAGPSAHRGDARPGRVLVVPGGHRPGKPDQLQRDRSRAQLPIAGPSRIVVLGCTVGAGQTVTTLLTGEVLASLRADQVAALDLNPSATSLAQRAKARPALNQAASLGPSRLEILGRSQVVGPGQDGRPGEPAQARGPADDARAFELASTRYQLVLADPSTSAVPRLLAIADQLVLVAPASAAAAGAIAMTFEWLEAHGQVSLSGAAIMVMNGVSRRTTPQVEQAERVAAGRCRAIVRVPWDDQLGGLAAKRARPAVSGPAISQHQASQRWTGLLSPATAGAFTALAGVLVASLAELPVPAPGQRGQPGQASR